MDSPSNHQTSSGQLSPYDSRPLLAAVDPGVGLTRPSDSRQPPRVPGGRGTFFAAEPVHFNLHADAAPAWTPAAAPVKAEAPEQPSEKSGKKDGCHEPDMPWDIESLYEADWSSFGKAPDAAVSTRRDSAVVARAEDPELERPPPNGLDACRHGCPGVEPVCNRTECPAPDEAVLLRWDDGPCFSEFLHDMAAGADADSKSRCGGAVVSEDPVRYTVHDAKGEAIFAASGAVGQKWAKKWERRCHWRCDKALNTADTDAQASSSAATAAVGLDLPQKPSKQRVWRSSQCRGSTSISFDVPAQVANPAAFMAMDQTATNYLETTDNDARRLSPLHHPYHHLIR
jgi:hypothetical protein